jgi:hypothetical protein
MGARSLPGLLTKSDNTQVKYDWSYGCGSTKLYHRRDVVEENEVWVQYKQSRCTGDNKKKGK